MQTKAPGRGIKAAMFDLGYKGDVAYLTLDRPEARNAIPASGWAELAERLDDVAESDARVLVVRSSGDAFCAGADLGDMPALQASAEAAARFRGDIRAALDRLRDLPIPTIAAVDGVCYGGGVALAIACDIRVAGRNARFAVTPAKIGLGYPQEDVHRLVALVGPGQAARLLFTAQSVDAVEASEIGLAELFEPEGGADALALAMAANSPGSLAMLKRAIHLAADGCRSDAGQDRSFEALIGCDEVHRRLEALRRK